MKNILQINILILLVFCLVVKRVSAQWIWQNPLPQGNTLNDVNVFNDGSAIAIGYNGTVIKTKDNGNTWINDSIGYKNNLNSMYFINESTGWIVGDSGLILKTINKGNTWEEQSWNDTLNVNLLSVYFINADTGWIGSDVSPIYSQFGILLKTIDGGKTWEYNKFYGGLQHISFLNSNFGLISSGKWQMYSITKDGGKTWTRYTRMFDAMCFIDSLTGFFIQNSSIYKTTDCGLSWNAITAFNNSITFSSIKFKDNKNGWAVGYQTYPLNEYIIRTTDGGINWSVDSNLSQGALYSFDYNESGSGYAVGYAGGIVYTSDWGINWKELYSSNIEAFRSIYFTDANNGWAVGGNASDLSGLIYNTTDGGNHWNLQLNDSSRYLNSVCFVNNLIGWAGGFNRIIKTTDGGKTWVSQYTSEISSIYFIDENNGWAVSYNEIINTTDGGNHWYLFNAGIGNSNTYYTVFFRNKMIGFIGGNGFILKTSDGGNNWVKASGPIKDICSISFSDSLNGTAISNGGAIFKTTDGGDSWMIIQDANYQNYFSSISYRDSKHGIIVGKYGVMLYTNDGGNSWAQGENPTIASLNSIFFIDSTSGWVVGNNGAILKYNGGNNLSSIYNKSQANSLNKFYLSQNYPNPFNPSTKIEYKITSPGIVSITIYDILGQKIKTVIDEYKSSGNYSLTVDLSNYSSGVYFYKIQENNFIQVKKMVLIK